MAEPGEWSTWRAAEPGEARSRDTTAPVAQRTRASGREVPERVRRPRTESGPGGTTLRVVGEDSPATTKGKLRLPFFLSLGFCVTDCGRRLWVKPFKCCRVSVLFGYFFCVLLVDSCCVLFVYWNCVFLHVPLHLLVNCFCFASSPFLFIDSSSCFT